MDECGLHRAATYGELREKVKQVPALIGFEVIEGDK
jgi:hypothetical protein